MKFILTLQHIYISFVGATILWQMTIYVINFK